MIEALQTFGFFPFCWLGLALLISGLLALKT
jgi:hypothetical protein